MRRTIEPCGAIAGEVYVPGDKSVSHRALIIGALARGRTVVRNLLDCDDCNYTMRAFREMGISITGRAGVTSITGKGLRGLLSPSGPLFVGSSGTSMRLLAGVLAGQNFESVLTGDPGLLKRPMRRVVDPLRKMGVDIRAEDNEHPPLYVRGGAVFSSTYDQEVPSAQVKSAILFAGLSADGETIVREKYRTRDHTERMLKAFGADITIEAESVSLKGKKELVARNVEVPGDISSAAFFIAAATVLEGSRLAIRSVSINPTRCGIIDVLKRMGARITLTRKKKGIEPVADIEVRSSKTRGTVIRAREIPLLVDEIPAIAVVAALSKGKTVIERIGELRFKETDRVESIAVNLAALGVPVEIKGETMVIHGLGVLKGASLKSFNDHRTAMAMTVAALASRGASLLDDDLSVSKSFPGFFDTLYGLVKPAP